MAMRSFSQSTRIGGGAEPAPLPDRGLMEYTLWLASNCRFDGHRPNSSQRMIRTGIGIPNSQRSAYRILLSLIVTGTTHETINLGAVSLFRIG
jgi:hypothetical protein